LSYPIFTCKIHELDVRSQGVYPMQTFCRQGGLQMQMSTLFGEKTLDI